MMDLAKFPLDNQICTMEIASCEYNEKPNILFSSPSSTTMKRVAMCFSFENDRRIATGVENWRTNNYAQWFENATI